MRKLRFSILLSFQLFITFVALLSIYMLFALLDMLDFDMIGMIGFVIFQPIWGIALSSLTILICLVIGLPIRLSTKLRSFWIKNMWIALVMLVIGATFMILSLNHQFTEVHVEVIDEQTIERHTPNTEFALTGWFLIAFPLLHFYPQRILAWLNHKLTSRQ